MGITTDMQKTTSAVEVAQYDVIIVGAGPYGLSVAAHLRERGLKIATFGKPLGLWRDNMPQGMLLRSYWWATSLSAPKDRYDFAQYFREHNKESYDPLTREEVIAYGLWFQKKAVPELDETYVKNVKRVGNLFQVELEDGRVLHSKIVVMAPGVNYYVYSPEEYSHLPKELVSHSAEYNSFEQFVGKQVIIVGGGQGALETAAIAKESGVDVQLVSRRTIRWIGAPGEGKPTLIQRLRSPQSGTGVGWFEWLLERLPYRFHSYSREKKDELLAGIVHYSFGPMGSHWLRDRVIGKIPLHEGQAITEIKAEGERVKLVLADGKVLEADHIILGTGYRADIKKLPMLDETLIEQIQTYRGSPALNGWFESSVPGLYFVGFTALSSFGPFYRFIVGTKAAAKRVAINIGRKVAQAK